MFQTTILMVLISTMTMMIAIRDAVTYYFQKRDCAGRTTVLTQISDKPSANLRRQAHRETQIRRSRYGTHLQQRLLASSFQGVVLGRGDLLSGQEMCMGNHETPLPLSVTLKMCAHGPNRLD